MICLEELYTASAAPPASPPGSPENVGQNVCICICIVTTIIYGQRCLQFVCIDQFFILSLSIYRGVTASLYPLMNVRVGVGGFIINQKYPGCILLGKRLGSHGTNTYALPGIYNSIICLVVLYCTVDYININAIIQCYVYRWASRLG